MKTTLIIAAAGFGSRLSQFLYPKILLPYKNVSMIEHIINFWKADETIIVSRPENLAIIEEYTQNKYKYIAETRRGSAFAVQSGLSASSNECIILNWCDVVPSIKPNCLEGNLCFTSKDIECTYTYPSGGGVYGVFLFNKSEINYPDHIDYQGFELTLHDIISLDFFEEICVPAIDIGDANKYTEDKRKCDAPIRSFNKITISGDKVEKRCSDEKLRIAEENWYKQMGEQPFLPKIFSYNPLTMERIVGEQKFHRVEPLYKLASQIHQSKSSILANEQDCIDVYINKTINRVKNIKYLVNFGSHFVVNNTRCNNPLNILEFLDISNLIPNFFTPIHGDLTSSNVLWKNEKPYIIDPRGIFGKTLFYGDPDYDIAKIYYSKTNWHLLNKGLLIPKKLSEGHFQVGDIIPFGEEKIDFLLAMIWLSVTDYVRTNTLSVAYSYLYGSLLLQKWINKYRK